MLLQPSIYNSIVTFVPLGRNMKEIYTLLTQFTYVFAMIITINSDYFALWHYSVRPYTDTAFVLGEVQTEVIKFM
jgi:hypothetical protein